MKTLMVVFFLALFLATYRIQACGNDGGPSNCHRATGKSVEIKARANNIVNMYKGPIDKSTLRQLTTTALSGIFHYAAFRLKRAGHQDEAAEIIKQWDYYRDRYLIRATYDIGDHAPFSNWLLQKYATLELLLGEDIMRATRLTDLYIFNHTIPIVFFCLDDVDREEYALHFIPFLGITAYWSSYFTCVGFTWGAPLVGFLCGPVSFVAERAIKHHIAPTLSPTFWNFTCIEQ